MPTMNGLNNLYEHFKPKERLTLYLEASARKDWTEAERLKSSCPKVAYFGSDMDFTDRGELSYDKTAAVAIDLYRSLGEIRLLHFLAQKVPALASFHNMNAALAFFEGMGYAEGRPPLHVYREAMEGATPGATPGPEAAAQPEGAGDEEGGGEGGEADEGGEDEELDAEASRRLDAIEKVAERDTQFIARYMLRCAAKSAQHLVNTYEAYSRFCRKHVGADPIVVLKAWGLPFVEELAEFLEIYAVLKPEEPVTTELEEAVSGAWIERFQKAEGGSAA